MLPLRRFCLAASVILLALPASAQTPAPVPETPPAVSAPAPGTPPTRRVLTPEQRAQQKAKREACKAARQAGQTLEGCRKPLTAEQRAQRKAKREACQAARQAGQSLAGCPTPRKRPPAQ